MDQWWIHNLRAFYIPDIVLIIHPFVHIDTHSSSHFKEGDI